MIIVKAMTILPNPEHYILFDQDQKDRLFSNLAEAMSGVDKQIIERQLDLFDTIDKSYGDGVRAKLKSI